MMNSRTLSIRKRAAIVVALLCFPLATGVAGFASSALAEDSWGYDIAHDLMSPYCPGRTLATCPSPQAAELVQWIVLQEASGATQEQVIEMLVERFGDDILGAPKAEGATLWAYVLPVLGFLVGGAAAFLVLRRIVGGTRAAESGSAGMAGAAAAAGTPVDAGAAVAPPDDAPSNPDDELARIVDGDLELRA